MIHRDSTRTMSAGTMIVMAPTSQAGAQDEIEWIQVICTCAVVESAVVFTDDRLDYSHRPKSERRYERRGQDRHHRTSRTTTSDDGRAVGRTREHRFRQVTQ